VPNTTVPSLEEALAALDTPEADADLTRRAEKWAGELKAETGPGRRSISTDPYARVIYDAGGLELDKALLPLRFDGRFTYPSESEKRAAEQQAQRNVDALVVRQLKIYLRAADVRAIHEDPDRAEDKRVWQAYTKAVGAIAWAQGNKEADFIRRWRDLIAARNDAEEYDDLAAVRAITTRLYRLTGVPYPQLPDAAWEAADNLPQSERQAELDRLEVKYGPRIATNGNGVAKPRGRRQTRQMQLTR
jgi:hypothetical protein